MKSAIFESINDRSNIANAYLKMVNEANEENKRRYDEIALLYEDKDYPICVYEWGSDGSDTVIDLIDVKQEYQDPSYYEKGEDDYYAALAFDRLGDEELYRKILEKDDNFYIPPERLGSIQNGFLNTYKDLKRTIEEIGRDIEEDLHKDDIEIMIPEWAADYFENADDSGLTEEDKKLADDYVNKITSNGYELVYDGENLGFCSHPEFGLADNCVKYYLIKKYGADSEQNESVKTSGKASAKFVYNLLRGIDKNIASIASSYLENGKSIDDVISWIADSGISGTSRGLETARDAIRVLRNEFGNNTVEESVEDGWFDRYGTMIKELPSECIKDCTVRGRDAYDSCKYWVNELGFADGLDIPLAKGYLKWTGGWEEDEIASFDDEETAIRILWILANDAKEGMDVLSIGMGERFDDGSSTVTESRFHNHKVILTNIQWPDEAYDEGMNLPVRDSMTIEVGDNENIEDIIRDVYIDSYGVAPVNFRIARNVDLGFVEVDDVKKPKKSRKNEMVSQSDIDKLKKKNPKLKDISEER